MDWQFLFQDTGAGETYFDWMIRAWGWTVSIALCSLFVSISLGIVVGTLRTLPNSRFWAPLAVVWIEVFRNIPLLVQVFLWYMVIPEFIPALKTTPTFYLMVAALGLFTSSRIAEQVRAGIQSLPQGQTYAAKAMGFTTTQSYRYVILPMALRVVLPPLTSESMNLVKNSAVAFAVSIGDLTMFAMQAQEETSRGIELYLLVTILYAVTAFAINRVLAFIEARSQVPGFIVSTGGGGH
ncbi:amino acid ABC transporter permease [Xanthobacter sp. TB0139]|uniref:amino acid ABC transporter permease n=1 Tax=Xanthobacter sp. TB0139 TaxID=3459178 RepID=UPI00403A1166